MSETKIKDGTGGKYVAKVDNENRLLVSATTHSENHHVNDLDEEAYLFFTTVTPTATGDTFAYLKNTSNKDLIINWYRIWSGTSAEAIDIYIGKTGTPTGTTAMVPVNMNITSKNEAEGLFYEGVDITGLSGGQEMDRLRLSGDGKDVLDSYPGHIIIQKGGVLTLQALTGGIALEVTLSFYYK